MDRSRALAALVGAGSAALLLGALAFQYLGGLAPCPLCIWQRWPHAATIALAAVALFAGPRVRRALLALCGIALVIGAGIALFHVGVEQRWWEGTSACGGTLPPARTIEELRAAIMRAPLTRCNEVAWSLLGISMAGWNLLLSLGLAGLSFYGAAPRATIRE